MSEHLSKLRNALNELKFDGLLLTGAVSRFYLTGLRTSAGAVLLLPDRSVFITDFRYIEVAREKLNGRFTVEMSEARRKTMKIVCEYLPRAKRLGVEADVMTLSGVEVWKKAFAGAGLKLELVPAEEKVRALRAVKDAAEVDAMRNAQRIAEKALEETLPLIKPGVTERALCAELIYRMLKHGAERVSFDPIVASGPNGSMPHAEPSNREVRRGDFVTMDFGCVYDGYCSDMTRTVAVGEANDEMRKVYGIVLEAQRAGIAAARAGVAGKTIDDAARDVITAAGYGEFFGHGFGHGIGLEVHENPSANQSEEKPLPAGAAISAEPGIYLPGRFGVRIEDVLVLTETGCVNLMNTQRELLVV